MTKKWADEILSNVRYKLVKFVVFTTSYDDGEPADFYLQVVCEEGWKGRKWRLSKWMTLSELVQTAFLAVRQTEEHEAREAFTYKGENIFSPHYDVEALVQLRKAGAEDVRF